MLHSIPFSDSYKKAITDVLSYVASMRDSSSIQSQVLRSLNENGTVPEKAQWLLNDLRSRISPSTGNALVSTQELQTLLSAAEICFWIDSSHSETARLVLNVVRVHIP